MKIILMQIDKTQDPWLEEGIQNYVKRIRNYSSFEMVTISMPKNVRQRTQPEQKSEEARKILEALNNEDHLVLLDEKGKEFSSEEFAKYIASKQNANIKKLIFLIGGPFGFDDVVYKRANARISLSRMTFSHQMVRLFFTEQLYRAFTILRGEKYHHP